MKNKESNPSAERFTAALASVLSVSPEQSQGIRAQAKAEKPSPKTKYKYDPEAADT